MASQLFPCLQAVKNWRKEATAWMRTKVALMRTPFEPKGIVELVQVEPGNPPTAVVQFTHDHSGYQQGDLGRYFLHELTPMNAKLYISKTEISLDFEGQAERDLFFENLAANRSLGGFAPQDAAEKVGNHTISFDQSKFEIGYLWPILFR